MKKILLILLLLVSTAKAQVTPFSFMGGGEFALDFDGSTEYLSCTPALRLTGEYSLYDNFSDGNYDGWTVTSGAYSVVDSTPLSGGTKALKCTTAGIISIPCNQAYGQWEFDWYKGNTNNRHNTYIMASDATATTNYLLQMSDSERFNFYSGSAISYTNTDYIGNNTWYRTKVTRNTNGSFSLYIKGGAFGTDYVLVSMTGGSGTNPTINNTITSSNFFVLDLDANDMIANIVCQQGEGSLDLNSYERIYHADNRNMTKTGGYSWNGNGTHSIDTTSTDKRTGTYSSKIISTDVGDSTTNYINLPSANFDTLKQDANGIYEKYTLEFWVKSKGASALPRINIRIGNQLKLSDTISNIAFEKVVFNFQSNSLVSNQDIKLWINQADTVFMDDVSLTKSYDNLVNVFVKPNNLNSFGSYFRAGVTGTTASNAYLVGNNNTTSASVIRDETSSVPSIYGAISTSVYTLTSFSGNRIGNITGYNNGSGLTPASIIGIGKVMVNGGEVGIFRGGMNYFASAIIGHIQITKFTDISQSNVNSTTLTTAYNRGKLIQNEWTGGSPIEVAFYDWKGATANEMLTDKSGTGNNLTGTNIDLNDRIKTKFK